MKININEEIKTIDATKLRAYNVLPENLKKDAVKRSERMLIAAGKCTPTELGAAACLCVELALFFKDGSE